MRFLVWELRDASGWPHRASRGVGICECTARLQKRELRSGHAAVETRCFMHPRQVEAVSSALSHNVRQLEHCGEHKCLLIATVNNRRAGRSNRSSNIPVWRAWRAWPACHSPACQLATCQLWSSPIQGLDARPRPNDQLSQVNKLEARQRAWQPVPRASHLP